MPFIKAARTRTGVPAALSPALSPARSTARSPPGLSESLSVKAHYMLGQLYLKFWSSPATTLCARLLLRLLPFPSASSFHSAYSCYSSSSSSAFASGSRSSPLAICIATRPSAEVFYNFIRNGGSVPRIASRRTRLAGIIIVITFAGRRAEDGLMYSEMFEYYIRFEVTLSYRYFLSRFDLMNEVRYLWVTG